MTPTACGPWCSLLGLENNSVAAGRNLQSRSRVRASLTFECMVPKVVIAHPLDELGEDVCVFLAAVGAIDGNEDAAWDFEGADLSPGRMRTAGRPSQKLRSLHVAQSLDEHQVGLSQRKQLVNTLSHFEVHGERVLIPDDDRPGPRGCGTQRIFAIVRVDASPGGHHSRISEHGDQRRVEAHDIADWFHSQSMSPF